MIFSVSAYGEEIRCDPADSLGAINPHLIFTLIATNFDELGLCG